MFYSKEQIERAEQTDLADFLRSRGEELIRSGSEFRWKTHDSLTVKGNRWYRHSQSKGGYPISFVMEFWGVSFPEAMELLISEKPAEETEAVPSPSVEFRLPKRNITNANAIKYLTECRGLDEKLVTAFIDSGDIYEEVGHHNVVFVGKDKNGLPRYAHCRGTDPAEKFRIDVPGSDKAYNFSYEGTENKLIVFEAPIDLLSFIVIYPNRWEEFSYLSLGGVGAKALDQYLKDHPSVKQVFLALDSDEAGQEACKRLTAQIPQRIKVISLIPVLKDWNEVLLHPEQLEGRKKMVIGEWQVTRTGREKLEPVDMICMRDVQQIEVEWLWKPYIPFGKVTILQGNPGEGKTWFSMMLAAACTNRQFLPGMEETAPFNGSIRQRRTAWVIP